VVRTGGVGSPRHHALLAVGGFGVLHDDEAEVSGSSRLSAASPLLIGGHCGRGNDDSWQAP